MILQDEVSKTAVENYNSSTPWPQNDIWHKHTFNAEKEIVEKWLSIVSSQNTLILNAGSGGSVYNTEGTIVHLDIIEKYIKHFEKYLVGSIEEIDLPAESVDVIICVGSVLNYADAQRAVSEFYRILKPNGFLILEFERSDSAEFLCTTNHGKDIFTNVYYYNDQKHLLWLYSERHIRQLLRQFHFKIVRCKRIHTLSSLLNRIGLSEAKSAPFSKLDKIVQPISYPFSHNTLFLVSKTLSIKKQ
ncbi:MAG: class I SAM-dependent methyltransferase [Ruminococcus sp.]|nr:class I SAM-dependent methyltransferase [Ruminococcus sp.]